MPNLVYLCRLTVLFLILGVLLSGSVAQPQSTKATKQLYPLMVGDPAPKLAVGRWVKGRPTTAPFAKGRIYVVEFWATWCGPCKASIPHLTALQQKYRDRVTVIGVSVWEPRPAEVAPFVQKMGAAMDYSVTSDEVKTTNIKDDGERARWAMQHGKMSASWLLASGWHETGIPTAFIVDGDQRIAWIGDPMELDTPLGMIVGGTWNRARYAEEYRQQMQREIETRPLLIKIREARDRKEYKRAVELCDAALKINPVGCGHLAGVKFQLLLKNLKDTNEAYAFAKEAVSTTARNNFSAMAQIASVIIQDGAPAQGEYMDLALTAAKRAEELGHGTNVDLAETLARLHFLKKQFPEAIRYQTRVVQSTEGNAKADAEKRLAAYRRLAEE